MPDNHTQQRVYHYRSSAITNSEIEKPNANNLDFGEIAINYNAQEPSLFIKQNDSEIAQFVDKKYIEDNINSLSGLNDVNISSPMEEQSLVYDSVNNEYINKYALAGAIPYGRCNSSSTAKNFTATVPGITELKDGTCMLLKNGVVTSTNGFTINVNGLGAKPVYNNMASATAETTLFNINYTILFIYDETRVSGGCWIYYRGYDANTTYTNAKLGQGYASSTATSSSTAKTATLSSYTLSAGGIVSVKFSGDVPANATLNINSKGAQSIYYKGAKITNGVIKAGDTATFMYNTDYHLLTIDRWNSDFSGNYNDLTNKPELSTVATSGNYNDLSNKPTIGNGALTIKRNGTSLGSFSANQTDNKEIDISVPTKTSDLTNDSNFITSAVSALTYFATSADVVTALANKSDIFMCEFNGTALTPSVDEIYEAYLDGKVILCKHQENHSYGDEDVISYMTSIKYDPELSGEYTGYIQFIGVHEDNNEDNEPFVYQIIGVQYDNTPWTFEYEELGSLYIALHYAHYHANKTILDKIPNSISGKAGKVLTVNSASNGLSFESIPTSLSAMTNDAGFITSAVTNLTNFATSSNTVSALNNKVDKVSGKGLSTNDFSNAYKGKLDNIASGAEVNVQSDWNVSDSNSDAYIKNKPTIGNAALTIQKNSVNVGSFSANQTTNKTINIVVPTTASDVNALPDSTKYAASLSLDINSSTYVVTAQLKDQDGNNLGTQQTIDLPLETMVVSGSYISSAKTVSLVLQNGNKIEFSVADLVSGLQTEITDSNKLSADLIENGNTNKVFTSSEKTKLSNLASSLATTSASGYMSSTQVTKLNGIESGAEVNVQSDWNETNSGSDAYILNKPSVKQVYTVEFEVRIDSADPSIENAIVSSNTSYSEILNLINDGFEIKAHANVIADNEQIVYSIDMNRISSVGDVLVVFNGYIVMVPFGSSEILIAWDNNNSKWLVSDSSPKLNVYYNDDQSPTVFSISLLNSDSIRVINDFQYLNDIHITSATSGDILTYHTNEYGGDGYWTNITPNFITSAVTAMTNYATSANVVSELDKKVETFECEFTMTMDSSSQEEFPYNCTITCDKTVNEISSAAANGKKILAKCDISNMFAELSGIQYISYWEITNNMYNGENAYVAFDVDMIMVLVGEIHFSVFGYGEDNLWEILGGAVNSNDLDKVHNLQPVATAGTIGSLNDVAIYNSASSGQILQYDGTNWVNETLPSMPDVSNFITSAVTDLQFFATSSATVGALNNKVDKVSGKGLSTNDYTNDEKTKLDNIATSIATTSASGYMSSDMVAKLNGIESGATNGFNTMLVWYNDNNNEHIWSNERVANNYNCFSIKPGSNIKLGIDNSRSLVISALTNNSIENITYSELKQLRDSSGLTPNQQYRITDYETLINPYSFTLHDGVGLELMASAASHSFDIIVRAITNDTLDSNASACHHEGDTYFANSQLDKWKLEYTLDNDQTKYFWALNSFTCVLSGEDSTYSAYMIRNGMEVQDLYYFYGIVDGSLIDFLCDDEDLTNGSILYDLHTESQIAVVTKVTHNIGKGVIYHMIDEWDNDCPYDFKNILFKRNNFSIVASDRDDYRYIYLTDSNGDEYYRTDYKDVYKVDDDSIDYFINEYKNPVGETIYTKSTSAAVSTVVSAHTIFYEKESFLNDNQGQMWQIKHQFYNTLGNQNFDMVFGSNSAFMYTFQDMSVDLDLSIVGYAVKNQITKTVTTCGIFNIVGSLSRPLYVLPNNVFLSTGQGDFGPTESIHITPVSDNILIDSQYNTLCGFVNGLKMTKSMFNYLNSTTLLPNIFEYSHANVIFSTEIASVYMKTASSNVVFESVYLENSNQNIIISQGTKTTYIKNSRQNRLANVDDIKLDYCDNNVIINGSGDIHLLTTNLSFLYNIGYSSLYTKHCFSMQLIKPGVPLDMKYLSECIIDNPIIFRMDSRLCNTLTVSQNSNGVVKYYNEADLIQ